MITINFKNPPSWFDSGVRVNSYPLTTKSWWNTYKKAIGVEARNAEHDAAYLMARGISLSRLDTSQTSNTVAFSAYTPGNFQQGVLNNEQLFNRGKEMANNVNGSPAALISTQVFETGEMVSMSQERHICEGIITQIRQTQGNPSLSPRDTGISGEYGQDNWQENGLQSGATTIDAGLNPNVGLYRVFSPSTLSWGSTMGYYANGVIDFRNVNMKIYYELINNGGRNVPYVYNMLLARERVKRGTMLYQGQNREREVTFYTWGRVEPLNNKPRGLEYGDSGNIYKFANGEFWSKDNKEIESPARVIYETTLWGMILGRVYIWNPPNFRIGNDTSRINHMLFGPDRPAAYWKPNGSSNWQNYWDGTQPVSGAPLEGGNGVGMPARHYAPAQTAALAAQEVAWEIMPNFHTLELPQAVTIGGVKYTLPTGALGRRLSGDGQVNHNFYFGEYLKNYPLVVVGYKANGDLGGVLIHNGYGGWGSSPSFGIEFRSGTQLNGESYPSMTFSSGTQLRPRRTEVITFTQSGI
jgi:hypothetical protein